MSISANNNSTESPTSSNWKNVNNWHWIEKDCTQWAHNQLKERLLVACGNLYKVSSVGEITGEVTVNVRKGRIRQIFDLTINLELSPLKALEGSEEKPLDAIITDYMSDTDFTGFEFTCRKISSEEAKELRQSLWEALESFKENLAEVHGKTLLVAGNNQDDNSSNAERQKFNGVYDEDSAKKEKDHEGAQSFDDSFSIGAPVPEVYRCLVEAGRFSAWSRGVGNITGDSFSMLCGNIVGTFVSREENKSLLMDWKLKSWNNPSRVQIKLIEDNGYTKVKLTQSNVPASELEFVKQNWHKYYWEPIKAFLGCSYEMFS